MKEILIVDDEKSILDLLKVVFSKEGWKVTTCLSAPKAISLLENDEFDLLLCDIKMPQTSGMEVLKRIKKKRPDIPVVMMTAYGSIKQAVDALKSGAMDYVVKPFDIDELKIIVSQAFEQRRLKKESPAWHG